LLAVFYSLISDVDFRGTLAKNYGVWIQHGQYLGANTGTITNDYGIKIDGYNNGSGTIINQYGIYQTNADKNYIQNNLGLNTTSPSYQLEVAGNAGFNEYLYHNGDADTYLRYQTNEIDFSAGGSVHTVDSSSIYPTVDASYDIGKIANRYGTGYFVTLVADTIVGDFFW